MTAWLLRNRVLIVVLASLSTLVTMVVGAGLHGIPSGRMLYAWLLLTVCISPFLLTKSFSGRYTLLLVFTVLYFMRFAGADLQAILQGGTITPERIGFFTNAEIVILLGAALLCAGYVAGARITANAPDAAIADWPRLTPVFVGLPIWIIGSILIVTLQVFLAADKSNLANTRAFGVLGQYGTLGVLIGFLMQPLGLLMLVYAYARNRSVLLTALIIAVVVVQAAIGFVTDYKATALTGLLVVLLVRTLVDNRVSMLWMAAGMAFVVIAFPVFQAYRMEISGERGLSRLQAFNSIGRVLEIAWASRQKAQDLPANQRPPTFVERSDIKGNIEQIVAHAGVDIPYLHGATLVSIPMAFVPRIIAPDKEYVSAAQLYNRMIGHSSDDTYISLSHLGELYWNFGWLGVVLGMLSIGVFMGFIAGRFNLENGATLTRVMVFIVTVNGQCVLFEGEIGPVYVVWLRSMVAIGLLHLIFARRRAAADLSAAASAPAAELLPRFPNLLQ